MNRITRLLVLACCLGFLGPLQAQRAAEPVTLNFVNADIEAVARAMAAITGRNIVVDPRVKGTVTLTTEKPVSPGAAYNQFLATLRMSSAAVVDVDGLLKVVPEADAKLQGGAVSVDAPRGGSQIVTQIFRLNHENAANLVPLLRPLINPNNTINVNAGANALVITDYADNLQRMARIIAALDTASSTDIEILPLRHALAADLAPVVQRLSDAGGTSSSPGQAAPAEQGARTTVVAESRSNSLIVRAPNAARLALVRTIVERLDQPSSQSPMGNIYVVHLRNADATKLATTLRAALAAQGGPGAGGGAVGSISPTPSSPSGAGSAGASFANQPLQASASPSTGGQIQADPATNSLIITAPEPQYRQIRAVIDRLDGRRAQVFVESLIAEVNADRAAEFGIQWQGALGNRSDRNVGLLGTNFSIGGQNIISLATGASTGTAPSRGGNFGIAHQTNGVFVLGFLARFLESTGDGNVLSTPNLLTLDNEEAKIVIGENVPFVTGQYTSNNSSNGAVNPFQTIERKDVGLTLRVKPQISENGTVRLQILQEASSVKAGTENAVTGPTTNKRTIESTVLVEDGGIVVLGGLLRDEFSGNQEKIPGVSEVPVFGNLFKAETRARKKTNLMVFLRPVVVRDSSQSDNLSLDRYELMRSRQQTAQPAANPLVPIQGGPALPPLPAARAASAPR